MIFNEKRRKQYLNSLRKLPGKIASLRIAAESLAKPPNPNLIAFRVDGGLGDYIIAARTIRDFSKSFPEFKFDVFCKNTKTAAWVFSQNPQYRNAIDAWSDKPAFHRQYAAKINCFTYLSVEYLNTKNENLLELARKIQESKRKIHRITSQYPHLDGYLGQYAALKNQNRYTFAGSMAEILYSHDELPLPFDEKIASRVDLTPKNYITISNGYDLNSVKHQPSQFGSTKVYPHFSELIAIIKKDFPGIKIVQIGNESSTQIKNIDVDLTKRTTLDEAAGIIKGSLLHIDNEGGLVHIARCFGIRCCVIFGPTDIRYFGYPSNINIPPRQCGNCWWMEEDWMTRCVRGDKVPTCMYDQPASSVFDKIKPYLYNNQPSTTVTHTLEAMMDKKGIA